MTDQQLPTVDVIIAVRNEERRLGACIDSLLSQDYPAELVSIFVVDNNSSDGTREVAGRHAVTLLRESKPGPAAARNRAFDEGRGELIAYLDGHCIAKNGWISAMTEQFRDSRIGGAQARIASTATDPRVLGWIESSGMDDSECVLEDTIYGTHNIYPWILSGNCMYRRSAVATAGGFDDKLPACEDVDLAWKIVLSGYLLADCPLASVVHWNDDVWNDFARKSWRQGRGSAVLAKRYLPLGARNAFHPSMIWHKGRDRSLIALKYWGGYRSEWVRVVAGRSKALRDVSLPSVLPATRPSFQWNSQQRLRISTDAIYWFRGPSTSIVVHNPSLSRIVLDGSANLIWRHLALESSRDDVLRALMAAYAIEQNEAESDLDEFVQDLRSTGLVRIAGD